jgi:8-amino-3,8-dideoxy-alpha-D-manno-octulosonate transaminase
MKKNQNIIPKELIQGRKPWFRQIIKSNRTLYRFFYKLLRCNKYIWILRNFWKDTDKLFSYISIETCPICNRKCIFCPIRNDTTPREMMSNELFDKIIRELKELNYRREIILSLYGEPLLDKRLEKFVRKIKVELGSKVTFFTNGDFLTTKRFRELVFAGVDLIVVTQHDPEPSETIKNLFSQISSAEWKYISYKIIKEDSQILTNRGGLVEVNTLHPITCIPSLIFVRADGSIPLCCNDYYNEVNFGNVNQKKLIDIWNSPFYRKIRNELKRGVFNFEICKRCRGTLLPKKYESKS